MDKNFIYRDLETNSDKILGETKTCIRCGAEYIRGIWDFYSLCNPCFSLFDAQKMNGRFGKYLGGQKDLKWFEDVEEWLKANPYKI